MHKVITCLTKLLFSCKIIIIIITHVQSWCGILQSLFHINTTRSNKQISHTTQTNLYTKIMNDSDIICNNLH